MAIADIGKVRTLIRSLGRPVRGMVRRAVGSSTGPIVAVIALARLAEIRKAILAVVAVSVVDVGFEENVPEGMSCGCAQKVET